MIHFDVYLMMFPTMLDLPEHNADDYADKDCNIDMLKQGDVGAGQDVKTGILHQLCKVEICTFF